MNQRTQAFSSFALIMVVVVTASVVVGVYLLLRQKQELRTMLEQPTPSLVASPSPTPLLDTMSAIDQDLLSVEPSNDDADVAAVGDDIQTNL